MDSARIVGIYDSEEEVVKEIKKYESEGVTSDNFSVLAKDDQVVKSLKEKIDLDEAKPDGLGLLGGFFTNSGGTVNAGVSSMTGGATGANPGPGMFPLGLFAPGVIDHEELIGLDSNGKDRYLEELDNGKIILFLK